MKSKRSLMILTISIVAIALLFSLAAACGQDEHSSTDSDSHSDGAEASGGAEAAEHRSFDAEPLDIVTTSNIVADWVSVVGGDRVSVSALMPANTDPHTFRPSARDVIKVADADLVLTVGLSLEAGWLGDLVENAAADPSIVVELGNVVDPILFRDIAHDEDEHQSNVNGDGHDHDTDADGDGHDTDADGDGHDTDGDGHDTDADGDGHDTDADGDGHDADGDGHDTDADGDGHDTDADGDGHDTDADGDGHDTDADGDGHDTDADGDGHDTDADGDGHESDADGDGHDTDADGDGHESDADGDGHDTDADGDGHDTDADGDGHESDADGDGHDTDSDGDGHEGDADGDGHDTDSDGDGHDTDSDGDGHDTDADGDGHDTDEDGDGHDTDSDGDGHEGDSDGDGHDTDSDGDGHEGDADGHDHDHEHGSLDPHFWFDPLRVQRAVYDIAARLSTLDAEGAALYNANAAEYNEQLNELHEWIQAQVSEIPSDRRLLITSHESFGYFAERYGFEIVGVVFPSGTGRDPSAQETAKLIDDIRKYGVDRLFTEVAVSDNVANRVAEETGARIVSGLYTDSLGDIEGEAGTYMRMMRYNVEAFRDALKEA